MTSHLSKLMRIHFLMMKILKLRLKDRMNYFTILKKYLKKGPIAICSPIFITKDNGSLRLFHLLFITNKLLISCYCLVVALE